MIARKVRHRFGVDGIMSGVRSMIEHWPANAKMSQVSREIYK